MKDLNDSLQKREKLVHDARALLEKAESEERELSDEESEQYDKMFTDAQNIGDAVAREKKQRDIEAAIERATTDVLTPEPGDAAKSRADEHRTEFNRFLTTGAVGKIMQEERALQADSDTAGGYLLQPQMATEFIQALDNLTFVRELATTHSVANADSLGAVSLDADPADPTWVSEITAGTEDTTMKLGGRSLTPKPLAQFIKVSNTLLRRVPKAEALVLERLAYKTAVVHEYAFLNGSGAGEPLGMFVASDKGISTDRDVQGNNTATAIRADALIDAKFTLPIQYRTKATGWIWHRESVNQIAKLKDGEGNYLWKGSIVAGEPDTLLAYKMYESEYAPHVFSNDKYVGLLGDYSKYWIADALSMTIQRVVELYAATNQTGFFARSETDGMPVLEAAFVRVQLGS